MTIEFEYLSAIDFLLLMDNLDSYDLIRQEYYIIEQNLTSFEESNDVPDNKGYRQLLHRFLCCMKKYPRANFIDGYDAYDREQKYICVSDPEAENCEKFWESAWYRKVTTIVNISQRGEEECYQYWGSSKGSEIECGGFRVKTLKVTKRTRFISTLLRLSDRGNHERQIWHYHYTAWPINNSENDPLMFLSFVCSLNDTYTLFKKNQPAGWKPGVILIHCNDGTSSSAVYCILDICVTQFKYTGTVPVASTLQKMRRQAHSCLNFDADDYIFCYQAIHGTQLLSDNSPEEMESFVIGNVFGARNNSGDNFLHDICYHGCLPLLLRAGWWLDQTHDSLLQQFNYEGYQCVHIVARRHRGQKAVQLLEVLMDMGADLNAPDRRSGSTPLHLAVIYEDYELVTWMCQETSVNLESCDYYSLTAYQVAWKRNDHEMIKIFEKFDADCDQPYSSESESESEN
ncbi:receptor-type tyrosine-protein phosphatase S-like [Bacillus rossius redtenbacheri]|uniref:receptor-type tyrosine-protein phosphatase S-like n=1 Tax=Bacillus rossius redtenbacheri TaxID=93214 RepID=UPI002FDCA227